LDYEGKGPRLREGLLKATGLGVVRRGLLGSYTGLGTAPQGPLQGYRDECSAARRSRSSPVRRWVIHSGIVCARRPL